LVKARKEAQKSGAVDQSVILSLSIKEAEYSRLSERLSSRLKEYEERVKDIRSQVQ